MPIKAVQQFMLGTVLSNEQQARETLAAMKAAGYDGIELCGFIIVDRKSTRLNSSHAT